MDRRNPLLSTAEILFNPCCLKYIPLWLETATKDEIKGLKVIQAILKNKGKKKFRQHEKQPRYDLDQAAEDYRRRTMTSFYTSQFSSLSPARSHESEILKYKRLSELKCSEILQAQSLRVIENWIELEDDAKFKDLLITCIQGVYSVYKINESMPVTSNQDNYHWFTKDERIRMNFPTGRMNITAPSFFPKDKKKNLSVPLEEKKNPTLRSFFEPKYHQERMTRKMRGSGDFVTWVYEHNSSMYQNAYASKTINHPATKARPANSSTILRVLPISNIARS